MAGLDDLYQSVIVEHARSPRNFKSVAEHTHHAAGKNPLCGDEVDLDLVVDATGRITDVGFQGQGCAISRASASLMTQAVKGKTVAEARELFDRFHALVTRQPVDEGSLGRLAVMRGVAEYPMRVKCATLGWHVLMEALNPSGETSHAK